MQISEEPEDELTDELIRYQYFVYQEAALEHYGMKGAPIQSISVELLG